MAEAAPGAAARLDPVLLEVIACPTCHGRLVPAGDELTCATCRCAYPVRDGVPVLLADDARALGDA